MSDETTLYKVLAEDGAPHHGGAGRWHLPTGKRPGRWMPRIMDLVPCSRGYHVCEGAPDLLHWLGPVIWIVEVRGDCIRAEDKTVVEQARLVRRCEHWNDRTARLFAAACARDVLHLFEREHPGDDRVRRCIEDAEAFARGEIDHIVLAAARDAAGAAARDAAGDAAWAAARDAAWAAARAAAWAAARDAAGDAAWAAARAAQSRRLAHLLETGEIA